MSPPSAIEPHALTDTQTATTPGRLSLNGVEARRSKAPKISAALAAHASSEMFKGPVIIPWSVGPEGVDSIC